MIETKTQEIIKPVAGTPCGLSFAKTLGNRRSVAMAQGT